MAISSTTRDSPSQLIMALEAQLDSILVTTLRSLEHCLLGATNLFEPPADVVLRSAVYNEHTSNHHSLTDPDPQQCSHSFSSCSSSDRNWSKNSTSNQSTRLTICPDLTSAGSVEPSPTTALVCQPGHQRSISSDCEHPTTEPAFRKRGRLSNSPPTPATTTFNDSHCTQSRSVSDSMIVRLSSPPRQMAHVPNKFVSTYRPVYSPRHLPRRYSPSPNRCRERTSRTWSPSRISARHSRCRSPEPPRIRRRPSPSPHPPRRHPSEYRRDSPRTGSRTNFNARRR